MDNNRASSLIIIIGGLLMSILAMLSVIMTQGNAIGQLSKYLMVGGFFLGLFQPRTGFFVWLVACGYTDLLKRLMVIAGRISREDLPYVLGITPVMFSGVVMGCILGEISGSRGTKRANWRMLGVGLGLMTLNAALAYFSNRRAVSYVLQALANEGVYILLIFVVPVLFRNAEEVIGVWRFLIWVYLPVALYGIVQQIFGFQDFEIDYLRTGLSIEIKQLFAERVRAFSTLNSPTAFGSVCGILATLCWILSLVPKRGGWRSRFNPFLGLMLSLIFTGGLIASTSRSELLILPLVPLCLWCFQRPSRTKALYIALAMVISILIVSSAFLLRNLATITDTIAGANETNSFGHHMLNVNTYSDRLIGFSNVLLNPKAWSWLGFGTNKESAAREFFYCHDPISMVLVSHGAVGLLAYAFFIIYSLRWFHRQVFQIQNVQDRWLAAAMQAVSIGVGLVGMLSGSLVNVFPVNVFFWFCWGALLLLSQKHLAPAQVIEKAGVPDQTRHFAGLKPFRQKTAN